MDFTKGDKVIYNGQRGIITEVKHGIATVFTKSQTMQIPTSLLTKA
jgi:hypothetical protein